MTLSHSSANPPSERIQRLHAVSSPIMERTHSLLTLDALIDSQTPLPDPLRVSGRVLQSFVSASSFLIELSDRDVSQWVVISQQQIDAAAWEVLTQDLCPGDLIGVLVNGLGRLDTGHLAVSATCWWLVTGCQQPFPPSGTDSALDLLANAKRRERLIQRCRIEQKVRQTLEDQHGLHTLSLPLDYASAQHRLRQVIGAIENFYAVTEAVMPAPTSWHTAAQHTMLVGGLAYAHGTDARKLIECLIRAAVKCQHGTLCLSAALLMPQYEDETAADNDEVLLDFASGWSQQTIAALLEEATGTNPLNHTSPGKVLDWAQEVSGDSLPVALLNAHSRTRCEQMIWYVTEQFVLPRLIQPTVVTGFSESYAPGAAFRQHDHALDYFVMVVNGLSIAHGGGLITDPDEQFTRWARLNAVGFPVGRSAEQEQLLLTLRYGQPPMAWFALDLDRLALLVVGARSVDEIRLL